MVKSVLADEGLWSYCKQFSPATGYVVGLILGQTSKAADFAVHLARIPCSDTDKAGKDSEDVEEVKKAKPVKGLSLAEIKESWVANHACDVTRMLPGGMWVLGIFLVGQNDPFEGQQNCSRLRTILRHVRTELQKNPSLYGDSPSSDKLILHLNIQKNLVACRSADLDGSAIRPVDWKFQKSPIVWTQIESVLDLHYVRHLNEEESSKQLRNQLQGMLDVVSRQVQESVCTLSNELLDPDDLVESIFKKQKGKSSNKKSGKGKEGSKTVVANLFVPMVGGTDIKSSSGVKLDNGSGIMYFSGSPVSRVFVHQKSTVDEACRAVKQDIIRSIAARMQMHADSLVEEEPCPPEDLETLHEPPRRVMIRLPSTNVTFSDYLFPGEGPEEALVSSEELLDLTLELEDVETDLEVPAESGAVEWSGQQDDTAGLESVTTQAKSSSVVSIAVGALTVALIAFIIKLYISSQHSDKRM